MKYVGLRFCVVFLVIAFLPISHASVDAQSEKNWEIKIDYSGEWRALVESDNSDRRGYGSETITTYAATESATVRKLDDSSKEMCVELWSNGELVDDDCTSSGYGEIEVGKCYSICGEGSVHLGDIPGFGFFFTTLALICSALLTKWQSEYAESMTKIYQTR